MPTAKASANGQAIGVLPGGGVARVDDGMLDDEAALAGVEARTYWASVWLRLQRDKLALAGGVFIILLFLVAFAGAPLASRVLGHGPNEPFLVSGGLDADQLPAGPWTYVQQLQEDGTVEEQLFVLGSDSTLARDEFLRLLYGAQVSLEVGVGATLLSLLLGSILGAIAGFYRGFADTVISRIDRADDGVPVPPVRDHARGDRRDAPEQGHVRVPRRRAS